MVDVIIPVYRPDEKLKDLMEWLEKQTVKIQKIYFMMTLTGREEDIQIRKSLEWVRNSEVVLLKKEDFDHGGTRNQGAMRSSSEFILFMTQDAVPVDEYLIEKMLKPMQDKEVSTVYARQLPSEEAGVIEQYTRKFNYPKESLIKSKKDLSQLGIKTYFCSNVCAIYRKEIYDQMNGFVTKTIFNEDMIMAAKVIEAGYKIAYVADAKVVHSHNYTYLKQLKRNFDLAVSQCQYQEFFKNVKSEDEGIKLVKKICKYLWKTGKFYLIPHLFLQSAFKLIGYKLGLRYEKLPKWFVRKCSMNKQYWTM